MDARLDPANNPTLPEGVTLRELASHADARGDLTELFRNQWHDTPPPQQWNLLRSRPNALRGVHAHLHLWDYLCVTAGAMLVGLHDLRAEKPRSVLLRLDADRMRSLTIPPGVAHGFYSLQATACVVGASHTYDPSDHRRCRWDSPELGFDWPCAAPDLSDEDARAGGYAALRAEVQEALRTGAQSPRP